MKNLNELIKILHKFLRILSKKRKYQILIVLIFNGISSLFEIISIASIMPFISAITDPVNSKNIEVVKIFFQTFNLSTDHFLLYVTLLFVFLNILSGIIRLVGLYFTVRISFIAGSDIGQELYRITMMQNYEYHTKINSSNLISLVSSKAGSKYFTILP